MAKSSQTRISKQSIIDQLTKNNVILQQKSVDLIESMNKLSKNIDKLVQTFQKAAEVIDKGEEKEPLTFKLTQLIEQNKQLARGLLLLEQYIKRKTPPETSL
jgi:hypothetical protein